MSDPRIYHRVGPVAPEGRQIYDDIRRRDLGLTSAFNSEISTVNGEITTLDGTVTTLEALVNALTVTPVQVGTGTGYAEETIGTGGTGVTISSVVVTPVVAKPFTLEIGGGLTLFSSSSSVRFRANIYEGVTWIQNLYRPAEIDTIPWSPDFPTMERPMGVSTTILIANTDTTSRTFDFKIDATSTSGTSTGQHAGTFNAFQWTVG